MLIKLVADDLEIESQNNFYKEWKEEEPDDEYVQNIKYISSLDDVFVPYEKWINSASEDESHKYFKIKDSLSSFKGVYIADLNCEGFLKRLATNKLVDMYDSNASMYFQSYGVCDNASQAIEYYELLEKEGIANKEDKYVILMTPFFKEKEPEYGGWRWHKWGPYIGIQNKQCEYLHDEEDIEMIYAFQIQQMD